MNEEKSSDETLNAFQAEVERLAKDTDAIIADSWDDSKPSDEKSDEKKSIGVKVSTLVTGTAASFTDDDWSSDEGEECPAVNDSLAKELQLLDTLVSRDPDALSKEISKMIQDGEEMVTESSEKEKKKDIDAKASMETKSSPEQSSREKEVAPRTVSDIEKPEEAPVIPTITPTAAPSEGMLQLLQVAKESKSFGIDRSLFVGEGLRVIETENGAELVHFTGRIGTESRSIRTSKPLAKPQSLTRHQVRVIQKKGLQGLLLRQVARKEKVFKPFVVPFMDKAGTLSFSPRLVSYYEIEISKAPSSSPGNSIGGPPSKQQAVWDGPCIAVGLASKEFQMKDTMPGWKSRSFGFHSDDGSAWANHIRLQGFAHKFGVGDVVGCGLDYRSGGTVFYTLNGKFLGHASYLNDEELDMDWFPTIGFDSPDCVQCHFGFEKPFVFDLLSFCQEDPVALEQSRSKMHPPAKNDKAGAKNGQRFRSYVLRALLSVFKPPRPGHRRMLRN